MKKFTLYRVVKDNTILGTFIFRPEAVAFKETNGGKIITISGFVSETIAEME